CLLVWFCFYTVIPKADANMKSMMTGAMAAICDHAGTLCQPEEQTMVLILISLDLSALLYICSFSLLHDISI
ncbi:hypothetical protein ACQP3C_28220, partial [Escherichia coli]